MRTIVTVVFGILAGHLSSSAGESLLEKKMESAAPNTWVELCREKTGYRTVCMFVYAPKLGKFVLSGGNIGGSRHFETEIFDASTGRWTNAYPQGAPYKNEAGPTDAPAYAQSGPALKRDKNNVLRLRTDKRTVGYVTDSATHHQWTWNPGDSKLYAHLLGMTIAWDPATRSWVDLKTPAFKQGKSFDLQWASMCYDPVSKEILSVGGNSDEDAATPGSWVFKLSANKWEKLKLGSPELNALRSKAGAAARKVQDLVNAARNRSYQTESEAESEADLAKRAAETADFLNGLSAEIQSLSANGTVATARAAAGFAQTAAGLKQMATRLGTPEGQVLAEAQLLAHRADMTAHVLDVEPCGRAGSQMAYDAAQKKIVLFGGNRLDLLLADTWVYDCETRTWKQRYPEISPRPRSNYTLAYLPKSRKVVLAGGVPFEVWTYDTAKDEWKLLQHLPRSKKRLRYHEEPYCEGAPRGGLGAVCDNDVLVWMGTDYVKPGTTLPRVTWACRVDPAAADLGSAKHGVEPETARVVHPDIAPETYDCEIKPDTAKVSAILKSMSANRWTLLPTSAKGTARRAWGTIPYDPARHQFVYWGGGHSTYKWSDAAHYSLRTATWSTGYRAEQPRRGSFTVDAIRFFSGRPQIPNHVWESAAFDPPSGKVIFMNKYSWVYDPAARDWALPPVKTPFTANPIRVGMAATPQGAVALADGGLYLYVDKSRSWKTLAAKGIPGAGSDGRGVCYDAKRDCLWIGSSKSTELARYDMKTGKLSRVKTNLAPGFIREVVYVPELDMLLSMNRKEAPGGKLVNLAFDIEKKKWLGLELEFSDGKPHKPDHYWYYSRALAYDPKLKLALFFDTTRDIWALRLEEAGLKRIELKQDLPGKLNP